MQVDEIHTRDGFLALEADWGVLLARSVRPSFFLSHAWFDSCWPEDQSDTPLIVRVRDGNRTVGIAPFVLRHERWRGLPARSLTLMQNQDTPFVDLLLDRDAARAALTALLAHVAARRDWQILGIGMLQEGSATSTLLPQILGERWHLRSAEGGAPLLVPDGPWSAYWTGRSQRFKKTVRNVANRVERLGTIAIDERQTTASAGDCFEIFRAVAARSWKTTLPISLERSPRIARFFARLTDILHREQRLHLWVLSIDGVPVATEYHVGDGDAVYALRGDFDDRLRDVSPGAYLNHHIVQTYFARGVRQYDMGPGESEYKQRWATAVRTLDAHWIFNRTPYASTLCAVERRAVPPLRRLRAWWAARPHTGPQASHA